MCVQALRDDPAQPRPAAAHRVEIWILVSRQPERHGLPRRVKEDQVSRVDGGVEEGRVRYGRVKLAQKHHRLKQDRFPADRVRIARGPGRQTRGRGVAEAPPALTFVGPQVQVEQDQVLDLMNSEVRSKSEVLLISLDVDEEASVSEVGPRPQLDGPRAGQGLSDVEDERS